MVNHGVIIGHIPAGYLVAALLQRHVRKWGVNRSQVLIASLAGSVAPDTDLLWFYLIDNRQYHHHTYWPHYPIVWGGIFAASVICNRASIFSRPSFLLLIFATAGLIHMALDSIVGDIWWFAPWLDKPYSLFTVPARFKFWWLNFILHWSFILEIALCLSTYFVCFRAPQNRFGFSLTKR